MLINSSAFQNCCRTFQKSFLKQLPFLSPVKDCFVYNTKMAHSKWEYVRTFELDDSLLLNTWIIARVDGRGFHKLAKRHKWKRPNDERAIKLMNRAARSVMADFNEIILAYGQSDEYSFVFRRDTELFQRRSSKIITTLVSQFSSSYAYYWNECFPDERLQYSPSFDGRIVLYPTDQNLRDYLCWRQADCHINNLYNTTFWALVQQGNMTNSDAEKALCGTLSGDKNEILFSKFGINYNNEPEVYRKGTVLVQPQRKRFTKDQRKKTKKERKKEREEQEIEETQCKDYYLKKEQECAIELNCDIIRDDFWNKYPYLLDPIKCSLDVVTEDVRATTID